jgi:hypothetical protein
MQNGRKTTEGKSLGDQGNAISCFPFREPDDARSTRVDISLKIFGVAAHEFVENDER